jgi:hypothetical protein
MSSTVPVGSNRQLFLDDLFFDRKENVDLVLHKPELREVALESDRPWESGGVHYSTVLQDGNRYRMWYRAGAADPNSSEDSASWICYAESGNGIQWEKPNLGIVDAHDDGRNNIVFSDKAWGINPSVILDPDAPSQERYKMLASGSGPSKLLGYVSPDGIEWKPIDENPIHAKPGPFDSHNILMKDDERGVYVIYCRGADTTLPGIFKGGRRAIRRTESTDFRNWTDLEFVVSPDEADPPDLHIYTNAAIKYPRAQRAYLMFPMILYVNREVPEAAYPGLSDVQFITSRDGISWDRRFRTPYLSPGPDPRNWVDRNPIMGHGILQTARDELSMYYSELLRCDECRFSRCTIRPDRLVSVRGPYGGGEFTTPPLDFDGNRLEINYCTSGGGGIRLELQDDEKVIPGFSMDDCEDIFGDRIERTVSWTDVKDLNGLRGKPIRIRVQIRDADLFAFQFLV